MRMSMSMSILRGMRMSRGDWDNKQQGMWAWRAPITQVWEIQSIDLVENLISVCQWQVSLRMKLELGVARWPLARYPRTHTGRVRRAWKKENDSLLSKSGSGWNFLLEIKEGKIAQEYYRTRRLDFNKKQKEEYIAKTNMLLKPEKKLENWNP